MSQTVDSSKFLLTHKTFNLQEQMVGCWINGKPIYQMTKVLKPAYKADTITKIADLSDMQIDEVIYSESWSASSSKSHLVNFTHRSKNATWVYQNEVRNYHYGYDDIYRNTEIVFTIWYTKKTDSEGSFVSLGDDSGSGTGGGGGTTIVIDT